MRTISLTMASCLAMLVSFAVTAHAEEADMMTVTGEIGYRERIAVPPDSTATITFSDISRQDVAAPVIAQTKFGISSVPAPFELKASQDRMEAGHRYALRATIHDSAGHLRWTTDTVHPVDPAEIEIDLGLLLLKRVAAAKLDLTGGEWLVEDINNEGVMDILQTTLAFVDNGQVSGTGGCNRYTGTYDLTDDTLSFGPLAATRKACPPAISNQEQKFFEVLAMPLRASTDETGALFLTNEAGKTLKARRN